MGKSNKKKIWKRKESWNMRVKRHYREHLNQLTLDDDHFLVT